MLCLCFCFFVWWKLSSITFLLVSLKLSFSQWFDPWPQNKEVAGSCEIIWEIKVTARLSALNRMRLPASAPSKLKAARLKPPPAGSWLRLTASVSAGSCSRWALPASSRRLQDRWPAGRGVQRGAVTPGNLSNESVEAAGELATGLVARLALHHGN